MAEAFFTSPTLFSCDESWARLRSLFPDTQGFRPRSSMSNGSGVLLAVLVVAAVGGGVFVGVVV